MFRTALAFVAAAALVPVVLLVEREARRQAERDRELCERVGRLVREWQDAEAARHGWGGRAS